MKCEIIDVHAHVPPDLRLVPDMVRSFRRNLVTTVFISSLGRNHWPSFPSDKEVNQANEDTFDLCDQYAKFFRAYVYLNPLGNWSKHINKWSQNSNFIGVKLWISLKNQIGDISVCLPVLKYAADKGFPVLIHSFFRSKGQLAGELNPAEVARLAGQIPEVKIIMAHLGGTWEKGLYAVADQKNVFVDVSGGPPSRGMVETAIRLCGADRVLFGSDMPCRTVQSQLWKIYAAKIPQSVKKKILGINARTVFGEYF